MLLLFFLMILKPALSARYDNKKRDPKVSNFSSHTPYRDGVIYPYRAHGNINTI